MKLLIKRGRLIDPVGGIGGVMDLLIEDGHIASLGSDLGNAADEILDAQGLVVCAGLVDMHVHLRDPGLEYKEDIFTGTLAAARGGVTTVACMPNTKPATDCPEQIRYVQEKAATACGVRVYPVCAVTRGQQGQDLTDVEQAKKAGAPALSDDGFPIDSANVMRDALIRAKRYDLPVLSHCEYGDMVKNYAVNEGRVSRQLWLEGRPAIAEELMVMRDAMLAEETGAHVHIQHVSTGKSVDIIRKMKKKGVPITCETCPQYFTLTEDEILRCGSQARVNPPLRTKRDVEEIIRGLQDGTIDAIVTDHAPHSAEEKARPLEKAPSGMVGLETSLAVTLTSLYHTGKLELDAIIRKMTVNPANILRLSAGRLAIGADADVTIFDPNEEWVVDPEEFASKGRNTPFTGHTLKGRVKYTIVGGKIIYQDN